MPSLVRVTEENYSNLLSLYSDYISEDTDTGNSIIEKEEWEGMKNDQILTPEYFSSYRLLQEWSSVMGLVQIRQMFPHRRRMSHQYMVWPLYIHRDFRRRGHARYLLQESLWEIQHESSESVLHVSLLVNEKNLPAQKLYRSLGFSAQGVLPAYLHVGKEYHSVLYMVRILRQEDILFVHSYTKIPLLIVSLRGILDGEMISSSRFSLIESGWYV